MDKSDESVFESELHEIMNPQTGEYGLPLASGLSAIEKRGDIIALMPLYHLYKDYRWGALSLEDSGYMNPNNVIRVLEKVLRRNIHTVSVDDLNALANLEDTSWRQEPFMFAASRLYTHVVISCITVRLLAIEELLRRSPLDESLFSKLLEQNFKGYHIEETKKQMPHIKLLIKLAGASAAGALCDAHYDINGMFLPDKNAGPDYIVRALESLLRTHPSEIAIEHLRQLTNLKDKPVTVRRKKGDAESEEEMTVNAVRVRDLAKNELLRREEKI